MLAIRRNIMGSSHLTGWSDSFMYVNHYFLLRMTTLWVETHSHVLCRLLNRHTRMSNCQFQSLQTVRCHSRTWTEAQWWLSLWLTVTVVTQGRLVAKNLHQLHWFQQWMVSHWGYWQLRCEFCSFKCKLYTGAMVRCHCTVLYLQFTLSVALHNQVCAQGSILHF